MAPSPPREPHLSTTPKAPPMSAGIPAQNSMNTPGMGGPEGGYAQDYVNSSEIQAAEVLVQQQMAHDDAAANVAAIRRTCASNLCTDAGAAANDHGRSSSSDGTADDGTAGDGTADDGTADDCTADPGTASAAGTASTSAGSTG